MTGVWAHRELRPTLELALAVHPETRRVVVVAGTGNLDRLWVANAREDFHDYEDRLEFTYLTGLTLPDMQRELRSLPGDSLVSYTGFTFDKAPVMIWVSDTDKLCTYFNQQWLDFTGRALEAELGNGWTDGLHPEDYHRCVETYNTAFDLHQPFTMEYRLRRADGEFRWILDSGTARFSPGGKFLGYIGSCIDISERKAAEEALEDLSGKLISARENERARIARELHDDLNQRMALISIELEQLGLSSPDTDGNLRRHLQGIIKQAAEVSREIHRISYDLHPSKLIQLGLVAAVKGLCDELRSNHGLRIEFLHEGVPTGLPQGVSLCLYRIVQESLNNVIKHSGAEEAEVELRGTGDEVRLRVSDSGIGFDVESPTFRKGLGLMGMRERLRLVGGSISIDSKPSKGTEINVRVPFARISLRASAE